jgi:hypothetical protein
MTILSCKAATRGFGHDTTEVPTYGRLFCPIVIGRHAVTCV